MRLLIACDESGGLKEIICNKGTDTSDQRALQPFHNELHLAEGFNNRIQKMLLIGSSHSLLARANGSLQLVRFDQERRNVDEDDVTKQPQFDVTNFKIVSSVEGLFDEQQIIDLHKRSQKRSKPRDGFVSLCTIPTKATHVFSATKSGCIHIIEVNVEEDSLKTVQSHKVKAPLEFTQIYDLDEQMKNLVFAYGGEENLVKLADLSADFSTLKQLWEAKNVKNDRLDLKVPIWPMELKFLKPADGSFENKINYQFITISRFSHYRKYQTIHGRKPISSKALLKKGESLALLKFTNAELTPLGNLEKNEFEPLNFVTTDLRKNVMVFDSEGNLQGKIGNGDITGCVTFLDTYKHRYLLTGGLDRYARVYQLENKKLLCKCFTGGKISCLLILDDKEVEIPQTEEISKKKKARKLTQEEHLADDEELWSKLDRKVKRSKKE
ncbi:LAFE_0C06370g1_1 [Lachancea fermentati]|uniref:Ribosome biogenesis protein NSA1 n=1 Tax=Lachancea fermentati TaxID=4955 RepID=A0A1G4M9L6_LACFM|nr:LAFE_0C06370g1_1 [Lachancea fermentati]